MLFAVHMHTDVPDDIRSTLLWQHRADSRTLQGEGSWRHEWRCQDGSSINVFDVDTPETLATILAELPLAAWTDCHVTPLAIDSSERVLSA